MNILGDGVSEELESGIQCFRGPNGGNGQHDPAPFCSPEIEIETRGKDRKRSQGMDPCVVLGSKQIGNPSKGIFEAPDAAAELKGTAHRSGSAGFLICAFRTAHALVGSPCTMGNELQIEVMSTPIGALAPPDFAFADQRRSQRHLKKARIARNLTGLWPVRILQEPLITEIATISLLNLAVTMARPVRLTEALI